jgi:hypothetical protein
MNKSDMVFESGRYAEMKKTIKHAIISVIVFGLFAAGYYSATIVQHSTNSDIHSSHAPTNVVGIPREGGQGAFAALAEVVAILDANQNTDWSRVNIARLRDHLIDMNSLTLKATVAINEIPDGAEFIVTGNGTTLKAIQSMVPAHADELNKMSSWQAETQLLPNGVRLSMTSKDKNVVMKLNALGFFGLMATGAHHQPHHLEMAKGTMVH